MSKRSPDFARVTNDLYKTPMSAVLPLLPFLAKGTRFIEPCAGDGRLARHLGKHGHTCVWASDIAPQARGIARMNAIDLDLPANAKVIITNPPWTRPVLHTLIRTLTEVLPTWLLFDADWIHTEFFPKHGKRCAKIVSVGRVKWIEGSEHTGMDNVCWYYFNKRHRGPPLFFGRGLLSGIT